MANGQPVIQGGVNVASAPTALAATTITGNNKTTFSAYGGKAGARFNLFNAESEGETPATPCGSSALPW